MNKIDKPNTSEVITRPLEYKERGDNSQLRNILIHEQKNVCAYTQSKITASFAVDVEHFDPTLKNTPQDTYHNWFAVSAKWNRQKGSTDKWNKFQPILHPTATDLEERIIYNNGKYDCNENDNEAENLINFLNLNQENLVSDRINHLKTLRFLLEKFNGNIDLFKNYLLNEDPNQMQYLRAIQEEMKIVF